MPNASWRFGGACAALFVVVVGCSTTENDGSSSGALSDAGGDPNVDGGGPGADGGGPGGGSAEAIAACGRYYDALRSFLGRCELGRSSESAEHVAHDRERFVALCVKGLGANGTSVTPTLIGGCADLMDARKDCDLLADIDNAVCKFQPGSLDDGSACEDSYQCKGYCKKAEPAPGELQPLCGTCAPRATANGPCATESECPSGTSCIGNVCKALGGAGATCDREVLPSCLSGFYCDASSKCVAVKDSGACQSSVECRAPLDCIADQCVPKLGEGADCTGELTGCAGGLVCAEQSNKCTTPTYKKPGEPCDRDLARCEYGACQVPSGATAGVCPKIVADGAACNRTDRSAVCDAYAMCIDGSCQLPDPAMCK